MKNAIEIKDLSFGYGGALTLEAANLTIKRGEFVGLVGPNGGGKTTLLKLIIGLLLPDRGEVRVFDQHPTQVRKSIGYVPQFIDVDRSFPITVLDVVLMGRLGLTGFLGGYRQEDKAKAQYAMEQMGVWELSQQRLGNLSEGQRQRVLIARALAAEPRLLVLDEPTASVDSKAEGKISLVLEKLRRSITIVMVSHDLGLLKCHADRLIYVNRELLPFEGGKTAFTGKFMPPWI
jgi:zinc transport system ATP-binding protein